MKTVYRIGIQVYTIGIQVYSKTKERKDTMNVNSGEWWRKKSRI